MNGVDGTGATQWLGMLLLTHGRLFRDGVRKRFDFLRLDAEATASAARRARGALLELLVLFRKTENANNPEHHSSTAVGEHFHVPTQNVGVQVHTPVKVKNQASVGFTRFPILAKTRFQKLLQVMIFQ